MNAMICRLCGKSDNNLLDVFLDQDKNLTLKVYQCFGVWISKEDTITKSICRSCYFFTNSAYEHRIHSLGHDAKLKKENLIAQIKFPKDISQKDFLVNFDLADKEHFNEILGTRMILHPSIRKLKRKYPYVIIPSSCMKINMAPVVVVPSPVKKSKINVIKWYYKKPDNNKTLKRKSLVPVAETLPVRRNCTSRPSVSVPETLPVLRNTIKSSVPAALTLPRLSNRTLKPPAVVAETSSGLSNRTIRTPVSLARPLSSVSNRTQSVPVVETLPGPSTRRVRSPVPVVETLPGPSTRRVRSPVPVVETLPGPSTRRVRSPVPVVETLAGPSTRRVRSPVPVVETLPGPSTRRVRSPVPVVETLAGPSTRRVRSPVQVAETLPGPSNRTLKHSVPVVETLPVLSNRTVRAFIPVAGTLSDNRTPRTIKTRVSTDKKQTQLDKRVKEKPVHHESTTILKDRCVLKVLLERDDSLLQFLTTSYNVFKPGVKETKVITSQSDGLDLLTLSDEVATYICQTCNKIFDSKQLLWSHKKHHHKSSLRCGRCSKKFSVVEQLMMHMASHKPIPVVPEEVNDATSKTSNNSNSIDELPTSSNRGIKKDGVNNEHYHIVKNSSVGNSFKIVKSSTVVKNSESRGLTKIINTKLKQAVGTALLDLNEAINTSKTKLDSTEENNVVANAGASNIKHECNAATSNVPANKNTEKSNYTPSDAPPNDHIEESNETPSDGPPNDNIEEIDVTTSDVCVISDSDSEDCTIVDITPGPSKLSIDNVLLFALTPQNKFARSKPTNLEKTGDSEIAAAVETILPVENAPNLQNKSSSENNVFQTHVSHTNISETAIIKNKNSGQDYQSATKKSDQGYRIIYQNTSNTVEDIYLMNEQEKNVDTRHSTTYTTNPGTTNVTNVKIFEDVQVVFSKPEQPIKQQVSEPCTERPVMTGAKTSVDSSYLKIQPSTSKTSSNTFVISDDDSGSGDTSREPQNANVAATISEISQEKYEIIIPAVTTTVNKQADNKALVVATNEKNFVNYIVNKCCDSEKRVDRNSNKVFIRNIRMKGKQFMIPVRVIQARTDYMNMLFSSNITATEGNKKPKNKKLWDPQTAITATRTQDPFYGEITQQTPSTSQVNPQPQLTINVYDNPVKTTISSQKSLVINGMSYPTVNMANQSPATLPNKQLPYVLPKNTEDNCEKPEYILNTMQLTQPPQNLSIQNIINIDFQDNVEIPLHIGHKDVDERSLPTNCPITNTENTMEMPSDPIQQHRPMIRLKHISELMG